MVTADNTAEELIASVDATLYSWRLAFEPSQLSDTDPGGYRRRLNTFKPSTYFAKPVCLSPLVCAAFGWENTGRDILKCRHSKCGATICIAFHPRLNEEAQGRLCQRYLDMLASSHTCKCPFRSYAGRWSKTIRQRGSRGEECGRMKTGESDPEDVINTVNEGLNVSNAKFYVPPYFLSLSDDFLRFEDCGNDGSITHYRVKEGALQSRDTLHGRAIENSSFEVTIPDEVTVFCHKMFPDVDVDNLFCQNDSTMKVPYLLSSFGWAPCAQSVGGKMGLVVKCSICQATAWLAQSSLTSKETPSKRRRIDSRSSANLKLIGSHRLYCPYASGFSSGLGQKSEDGWKVVVSNLMKFSTHTSNSNTDVELKDLNRLK